MQFFQTNTHQTFPPLQLKSLSHHYQIGKPIPNDLLAKQISVKYVNNAILNLRQLHYEFSI